MRYKKRQLEVLVQFSLSEGILHTLEGSVSFQSGDAIVTANTGESWVVLRSRFCEMYEPIESSVLWQDGRYIKKPGFVTAEQQADKFKIVITGGILYGNAGDWLVEDANKFQWIVSNSLFRSSYDPA